jgi:hypothetical protein
MEQKKIKLKVSNKIDHNENIIRMGKKARSSFIVSCDSPLEMWANPFSHSRISTVQQAFREDLRTTPKEELARTIFVSKSLYDSMKIESKEDAFFASKRKGTCIGSDPEFAIFINTKENIIVRASELLSFEAAIGSDGPLGELRATPGINAKEHIENLGALIVKIVDEIDQNKFHCSINPYIQGREAGLHSYNESNPIGSSSSFSGSCGGHIHFGLTKKLNGITFIHKTIAELLDRVIALCVNRLDIDMGAKRRNNIGYGMAGDYKGSDNTRMEYRVLSGTWLLYKDLSDIILSVVSSFIEKIIERFSDYVDSDKSGELKRGNLREASYKNKIIKKLFPEIYTMYEEISYNRIGDMLLKDPNTEEYITYVKAMLKCIDNTIDIPEVKLLKKITECDYRKYKNLDPDFINNWTYGISVFEHLSNKKKKEI